MKTPLRFQVTEFDCGTVSLTNAVSYLFDRENIPAMLLKAIHKYTLDCYDENGNLGNGGTSREAVNKLCHWITRYSSENDFGIVCDRRVKEDVTIEAIKDCIDKNGCVFIRLWQEVEHYVIITNIKKDKVYIFDPYYLEKEHYNKDKDVKIVFNKPFTHNRIVNIKRLFSDNKKDFSLGDIEGRECVLMYRK